MDSAQRIAFTPRPLAILAAAFALGILGAQARSISPALLLGLTALLSVLEIWSFRRRDYLTASILLVLIAICTGAMLAVIEQRRIPPNQIKRLFETHEVASGDPVELTGVLEGPPETAPESFYLRMRVEKIRLRGEDRSASGVVELQATLRERATRGAYSNLELRYGARLRVMVRLERADQYRNPGVSSFTEFLDRRGYDATGVIKSPLLVERLDDQRVFLPLAWLYRWHETLEKQINETFSPETAGVLVASLLGNRHYLSRASAERFRQGGTFHILVINGLHISFIALLVLVAARRVTASKSWQFMITLLVLWSYALAVGAQAAVIRASIMFTFVGLAPLLSRRASSLNALGGAAIVLLVWRPSELFNPSFQLTFLSVLSIVVLAAPLLLQLSQIGTWRPTRGSPCPPRCARWLRGSCEALFWSERAFQAELARSNHSYRLFKSPWAVQLERFHLQRFLRYALGAIVVSASVQMGMLPLLIIYFHRVSPVAILLNIFVAVLMAVTAVVALVALLMTQLSAILALPLVSLANLANWLLIHGVDLFSPLGGASFRVAVYPGWWAAIYALYFLPLLVLTAALARWRPLSRVGSPGAWGVRWRTATSLAAMLQIVMLLIVVLHPLSAPRPDGRLHVAFLDVGQGDAALVTMPDGTTLLIDGGGRPSFGHRHQESEGDNEEVFERDSRSIGEAVVSEYLWEQGRSRIDYVLATHADADHIDGLNDVVKNFQVRAALVARAPNDDSEFAKFSATLAALSIPWKTIGRGDQLSFSGATATVLWPPLSSDPKAPSANNDSIVLSLQFGERKILMTGDVEKEAESALLKMGPAGLSADVVKVPHHGSRTSSTSSFVSATHPQFVVISVSQTSIFGHPHKEVVERWRANGAEVLTTGSRGTIMVSTDGHDLRVTTFVR